MPNLRVAIIDDEAPARQQLARYLAAEPDIEIAGEATNGIEALELIAHTRPDAVFLDIEMPGLNGLEVAANLSHPPLIVFVTAFDEYAVKAFEAHATDYIMKPLDPERLQKALQRIRQHAGQILSAPWQQMLAALQRQRSGLPARLAARKGKRIVLLSPKEILYITTEDKLVFAVTADGRAMIDRTVADLETLLEPEGFFRISRGELANVQSMRELIPWFSGTWRVRMSNGAELDVSRERARKLKDLVGA